MHVYTLLQRGLKKIPLSLDNVNAESISLEGYVPEQVLLKIFKYSVLLGINM